MCIHDDEYLGNKVKSQSWEFRDETRTDSMAKAHHVMTVSSKLCCKPITFLCTSFPNIATSMFALQGSSSIRTNVVSWICSMIALRQPGSRTVFQDIEDG